MLRSLVAALTAVALFGPPLSVAEMRDGSALYIDEKGQVGIGTTQPKATLDVVGEASLHGLEVAGETRLQGPVTIQLKPEGRRLILNVQPDDTVIVRIAGPNSDRELLRVQPDGALVIPAGGQGAGAGAGVVKIEGDLEVNNLRAAGSVTAHALNVPDVIVGEVFVEIDQQGKPKRCSSSGAGQCSQQTGVTADQIASCSRGTLRTFASFYENLGAPGSLYKVFLHHCVIVHVR